jgi:predicted restriction endonuclease
VLSGNELRELTRQENPQYSIRRLHWPSFVRAVEEKQLPTAGLPHLDRTGTSMIKGGFKDVVVRARIGQASFRRHLLANQGERCAFTGRSVDMALDAAHLYQYADHQRHDLNAGILLRKDLHALFDGGFIAIETEHSGVIRVSTALYHVPEYARLNGEPLKVPLNPTMKDAFDKHFNYNSELILA